MGDVWPRNAIEQNLRRRRGEDCRQLVSPASWEGHVLQEGEDVVPTDRVKGLGDIKFYEEHRGPVSVESPCHIAHIKKVVVDTAAANKGALALGNDLLHHWCET